MTDARLVRKAVTMGDPVVWSYIPLDDVAPGTKLEDVVRAWWESLPAPEPGGICIRWLDLAVQQFGSLSYDTWTLVPVSKWQNQFPTCSAALIFDRLGDVVRVYGLLKLLQHNGNTPVIKQLVHRHWLHSVEMISHFNASSLETSVFFPTLETVHAQRPDLLENVTFDLSREADLIAQCSAMLVAFAKAKSCGEVQSLLTARFNYTSEEMRRPAVQLRLAKMRYYVTVCLTGLAHGRAPGFHDRIIDTGLDALEKWTSSMASIMCPTEKHVADVVSEFKLPLRIKTPEAHGWLCLNYDSPPVMKNTKLPVYLQLGIHNNTEVMKEAYRKHAADNENAAAMIDPFEPCAVLRADGTRSRVRFVMGRLIADQSRFPLLYDRTLPVSFFCRLRGMQVSDAPKLVRWLIMFMCHNMVNFTPASRITVSCVSGGLDGSLFFSVQEFVFRSGTAQMEEFLRAWALQYRIADALVLPSTAPMETGFVPHLHPNTFDSCDKSAVGEPIGTYVYAFSESAQQLKNAASAEVRFIPQVGEPFVFHRFGSWLGGRVIAEVRTLRARIDGQYAGNFQRYATKILPPSVASLWTTLIKDMGSPIFNTLQSQMIAASVDGSAFGASDHGILWSSEYMEATEDIGSSASRICAFVQHLLNCSRAPRSERGGEVYRFNGDIVVTVSGKWKYNWIDYSSGSLRGRTLGELVVHHHGRQSMAEALYYMQQWIASCNMVGDTAAAAAQRSPPSTPEEHREVSLQEVRARMQNMMSRLYTVSYETTANRYLRITRGLSDAPLSLIEKNDHLRCSERITCLLYESGERILLPGLVVVTQTKSAVQTIFLNASTLRKATIEAPKRNNGSISIGYKKKDCVAIQQCHETRQIAFVSEGPETGLSIACALGLRANVFVTLGIGNIAAFTSDDAQTVVWCRENDEPPDPLAQDYDKKVALKAEESRITRAGLSSRYATVIEVLPDAEFNDFNDVHQRHNGAAGSSLIRDMFKRQLSEQVYTTVCM